MDNFNFADSYKAAGLSPGPDIIGLRQESFNKLLEQINSKMNIDLARLYFGLPVPNGTDWFRDVFVETDPSFSMLDNEREVAVLAACLLDAANHNDDMTSALIVLTTSAAGNREPLVLPELIEDAKRTLLKKAIEQRNSDPINLSQVKYAARSKVAKLSEELLAAPDWSKGDALFKQISSEGVESTKALTDQVQNVLGPLIRQVTNLKEEVDMLWWHIGGWSRILEKPFYDIELALAATMTGVDLADLSQSIAGPAAATAILHRTLTARRKGKVAKEVTIKEAVDALPTDKFDRLALSDELRNMMEICPVLAGFHMAAEIGESPSWESAFKKAANFDSETPFIPLELAMQVYREKSLLTAID